MSKDRLRRNWQFFERSRDRFARTHHGKYVVIRNKETHGFHDLEQDAYWHAIKSGFPRGSFYIGHCVFKHEEVPAKIRVRATPI